MNILTCNFIDFTIINASNSIFNTGVESFWFDRLYRTKSDLNLIIKQKIPDETFYIFTIKSKEPKLNCKIFIRKNIKDELIKMNGTGSFRDFMNCIASMIFLMIKRNNEIKRLIALVDLANESEKLGLY